MLNEKIYGEMEKELRRYGIEDEVEDVLLSLAESLAERGTGGEETICREKAGKTVLEALGYCRPSEEDEDAAEVYLKWVKIGSREYVIEDYVL